MTDLERAQKTQAAELLLRLTDDRFLSRYQNVGPDIFDSVKFVFKPFNLDKRIIQKVKELRENLNCEVYAITHELSEFGECYSFLIVPEYQEDWDKLLRPGSDGTFLVYAYVWNTTHEECSESGYIAVKFGNGMLRRVG